MSVENVVPTASGASIRLNEGQRAAFSLLAERHPFSTVIGYAGTGKSTAAVAYLRAVPHKRVLLTAPTQKATSVLRKMCREQGLRADVETIHRALSLRLRWENGEQVLRPTGQRSLFSRYDIVIVDEGSMIGDFLYAETARAAAAAGVQVIYLGDAGQLPPVEDCEEEESRVFGVPDQVELTEIMRQTGDSAIPLLGEHVREGGFDLMRFIDDRTVLRGNWSDMLDDFVRHPERDTRYLAWRNASVQKAIGDIRTALHGEGVPELLAGERVAAVKPVIDPHTEQVVHPTDSLLVLEDVAETDYHGLPAWRVVIEGAAYVAVRQEAHAAYKAEEQRLRERAMDDRKRWKDFYAFVNGVCWLRPAEGMTVHKSQGSTFHTTYVDVRDIRACRDPVQARKLLYVACTRPSDRLVLLA